MLQTVLKLGGPCAVVIALTLAGLYSYDHLVTAAIIATVVSIANQLTKRRLTVKDLRVDPELSQALPISGILTQHGDPALAVSSKVIFPDISAYEFDRKVTYDIFGVPLPGDAGELTRFSVHYMAVAIPLHKKVPHIFIDGIAGNSYSKTYPNLWILSKALDRTQRLQKLEGDFPTYFDVYSTENNSRPLSIVTPDVMLALREKGIIFDYELYGTMLYIYREPYFASRKEIDEFIESITTIAQEIIHQVSNQDLSDTDLEASLDLRTSSARFWGVVYSLKVIGRIAAYAIVSLLYVFAVRYVTAGAI